ncbi:MAG: hypothetical protein JST96_05105, partial [Bacteroidetes bacterium]|nr:hypothetical protein [Bacteroidota bacterium]
YYVLNGSGQMTMASKSNILKMFEKDKKTVEAFIKSNKISFSKDADLQKLLDFCTSIPASVH